MKKTLYIVILVSGFLSACQQDDTVIDDTKDRSIYLAARIENSVQSRTPYLLTAPTMDKPLWTDIWASTAPNSFPYDINNPKDGTDGTVAIHTTAKFTAGKEQLLDKAIYPNTNGTSPVYFVGLHPQGWTGTETSANYTFQGYQDVMFAPQISGKYAENAESTTWPTFTFKHLLTWLRIEMVADSEDVSKAWGQVEGVSIKSEQIVNVDLSKQYDATTCVSFTSPVSLDFYQTDSDVKFENYILKGPQYATDDDEKTESFAEEVAYVLCAPVTATDDKPEYTLTVTTAKRTVDVNVDLLTAANTPFTDSTMNHQFTILLRFKLGNNISATAIATDWVNGGLGNGEFNE